MRQLAIALLGLALLPALPASAQTVGLDSAHGFDIVHNLALGGDYDDLRLELSSGLGISLRAVSSFRTADLAGLDALFLLMPYSQNSHSAFTPDEISDIRAFVTNGGGLVVLAEGGAGGNTDTMNALVAGWDVSFAEAPVDPDGRTVTGFVVHPLTLGVAQLVVDFQRPLSFSAGLAEDLTNGTGNDNVLAVVEDGGRAVLLSDSTLWKDDFGGADSSIDLGQNRTLLRNSANYVTGRAVVGLPAMPRVATVVLVLTLAAAGGYYAFRRSRSG